MKSLDKLRNGFFTPRDYCEKYGLDCTSGQRVEAKTRHLLERQRKLDKVKDER